MNEPVDYAKYEFSCPNGEWLGRLDGKRWGKGFRASNLVLYFSCVSDGKKYQFSVFQTNGYGPTDKSTSFKDAQSGQAYLLTTRMRNGKPYFVNAVIEDAGRPDGSHAPSALASAEPRP